MFPTSCLGPEKCARYGPKNRAYNTDFTPSIACAVASAGDDAVVTCPKDYLVNAISFAFYGSPNTDTCGAYRYAAPCGTNVTTELVAPCVGQNACSVVAPPSTDDCGGDTLAIQAVCVLPDDLTPTQTPSAAPVWISTQEPTETPETAPEATPEAPPVASPDDWTPTDTPNAAPEFAPEAVFTQEPTATPSDEPTDSPEAAPIAAPVAADTSETICGTGPGIGDSEGGEVDLSCATADWVISSIDFASYGTPSGTCGAYQYEDCNAAYFNSVVSDACLGQTACVVSDYQQDDPCYFTQKHVNIQATCAEPVSVTLSDFQTTSPVAVTGLSTTTLYAVSITSAYMNGAWVYSGSGGAGTVCLSSATSAQSIYVIALYDDVFYKMVLIELDLTDGVIYSKALGAKVFYSPDDPNLACANLLTVSTKADDGSFATSAEDEGYGVQSLTLSGPATVVVPSLSPTTPPTHAPTNIPSVFGVTVCGEGSGTTTEYGEVVVTCPDYYSISSIPFASYGLPTGTCGEYAVNNDCHASTSVSVVSATCVGQTSCTVYADYTQYGGDPCGGYEKHLYVQASCAYYTTRTVAVSTFQTITPTVVTGLAPTTLYEVTVVSAFMNSAYIYGGNGVVGRVCPLDAESGLYATSFRSDTAIISVGIQLTLTDGVLYSSVTKAQVLNSGDAIDCSVVSDLWESGMQADVIAESAVAGGYGVQSLVLSGPSPAVPTRSPSIAPSLAQVNTVSVSAYQTSSSVVVSGLSASDLSWVSISDIVMNGGAVNDGAGLPATACSYSPGTASAQYLAMAYESPYTKMVLLQLDLTDSHIYTSASAAKYYESNNPDATCLDVPSYWLSGDAVASHVAGSNSDFGYGVESLSLTVTFPDPSLSPTAAPTTLSTTFSEYVTTSAQTVSGVATSSLDYVSFGTCQISGSNVNGVFTGGACVLAADASNPTSRQYVFYAMDGKDMKMVLVQVSIVDLALQLTGVNVGYMDSDQTASCTAVSAAWTSSVARLLTSGSNNVAGCQSCSGYGVSNIVVNYMNFISYAPSESPSTVSDLLTSSLDNVLIISAQMAGGSMGATGSATLTSSACRLSSDATSTSTRNYIFYSVDLGYTKMVQVKFVLVNNQLQLTGVSSGYRTTDFSSSCTAINTAWTSRTNNGAGGIATCQTCNGYGIKNIGLSYLS
eukprot:gene24119-30427_t